MLAVFIQRAFKLKEKEEKWRWMGKVMWSKDNRGFKIKKHRKKNSLKSMELNWNVLAKIDITIIITILFLLWKKMRK